MFTMKDFITREEQAVMNAMVNGIEKNGKIVRALENIEDGSNKSINNMLHEARANREQAAKNDFLVQERARLVAKMKEDKKAKGKI